MSALRFRLRGPYCCLQLNRNRHIQTFRPQPARNAADRGRILRVKPRPQPDIALIRAAAVGRIKPDPAQPVHIQLGPGMRRLMRRALGARCR